MPSHPKHQAIFEELHREIREGRFAADGRVPSDEALCRRFGVSRPTVARALRELQGMGLVDRRAGSGTYVRPVERGVRRLFGLLADGLGRTEIMDPICAEIARAAQARQCGVLMGGGAGQEGHDPRALCAEWSARGVAGVFFAPLEHEEDREALNREIAERLAAARIPVVLLDRDLAEFPRRSGCDLVGIDNFRAGCLLAGHLLARGSRRITFLARPRHPSTTDLRLAGAREAARRAPGAAVSFQVGEPNDRAFVAAACGPEVCDAVVGSNDLTAAQVLQTLQNLGVRVPEQVRVAGFDDVRYATLLAVPLTTMRQPCRDLGAAAVETMLARLAHPRQPPRQVLLNAPLVVRASTGPELAA